MKPVMLFALFSATLVSEVISLLPLPHFLHFLYHSGLTSLPKDFLVVRITIPLHHTQSNFLNTFVWKILNLLNQVEKVAGSMDYLIILFNFKPSWKLLNNNELEFPASEVVLPETHNSAKFCILKWSILSEQWVQPPHKPDHHQLFHVYAISICYKHKLDPCSSRWQPALEEQEKYKEGITTVESSNCPIWYRPIQFFSNWPRKSIWATWGTIKNSKHNS